MLQATFSRLITTSIKSSVHSSDRKERFHLSCNEFLIPSSMFKDGEV